MPNQSPPATSTIPATHAASKPRLIRYRDGRGASDVDAQHPQPFSIHFLTETVSKCRESMLSGGIRPYLPPRRQHDKRIDEDNLSLPPSQQRQ
jgi:hypothetical protein